MTLYSVVDLAGHCSSDVLLPARSQAVAITYTNAVLPVYKVRHPIDLSKYVQQRLNVEITIYQGRDSPESV